MSVRFDAAERIIGYGFQDKDLLACALTHSSYANEHGCASNERLEFLGDGILNFLVAESLYFAQASDEGALTKTRAQIVSRAPLAQAVDSMGLLTCYRLGNGARKEFRIGEKFKSNLFESVLGAIYLDGGMDKARAFVTEYLLKKQFRAPEDSKSKLQERLAVFGLVPRYETVSRESGFVCNVHVKDHVYTGYGKSKAAAEQAAACEALKDPDMNRGNKGRND